MLLFDLVCSRSLLKAANLDSSVPLVKMIDLIRLHEFDGWYSKLSTKELLKRPIMVTCIDYQHQDLAQILAENHD